MMLRSFLLCLICLALVANGKKKINFRKRLGNSLSLETQAAYDEACGENSPLKKVEQLYKENGVKFGEVEKKNGYKYEVSYKDKKGYVEFTQADHSCGIAFIEAAGFPDIKVGQAEQKGRFGDYLMNIAVCKCKAVDSGDTGARTVGLVAAEFKVGGDEAQWELNRWYYGLGYDPADLGKFKELKDKDSKTEMSKLLKSCNAGDSCEFSGPIDNIFGRFAANTRRSDLTTQPCDKKIFDFL